MRLYEDGGQLADAEADGVNPYAIPATSPAGKRTVSPANDDMVFLRQMISREVSMWEGAGAADFTYAGGVRDGLKAALQFMDAIAKQSGATT